MSELTIWTLDWVPDGPRGFVRDLRLRWACEEAGLPYAVRTVPFDGRETNHLADQPFGQVPFLKDNGVELFESGACLLHLAGKSDALMPRDPAGEAATVQWTVAALNSIEMVTVPWWFLKISGDADNGLTGWMTQRLCHMERVLGEQEWLAAGRFTVADLLMADVLRVKDVRAFGDRPATEAYVARVTARPAFRKARADQVALFEAEDRMREKARESGDRPDKPFPREGGGQGQQAITPVTLDPAFAGEHVNKESGVSVARCSESLKVQGVLLPGPPGGRWNPFCCPVGPTAHFSLTLGR